MIKEKDTIAEPRLRTKNNTIAALPQWHRECEREGGNVV